MKTSKTLLLAFLLISSLLYSQTNTFKLGFTGAYPNYWDSNTYKVDWSHYGDLNFNTWQGWWVGDTAAFVFDKLDYNNLTGWCFFSLAKRHILYYIRLNVEQTFHCQLDGFFGLRELKK
jgi:hypothetical protein